MTLQRHCVTRSQSKASPVCNTQKAPMKPFISSGVLTEDGELSATPLGKDVGWQLPSRGPCLSGLQCSVCPAGMAFRECCKASLCTPGAQHSTGEKLFPASLTISCTIYIFTLPLDLLLFSLFPFFLLPSPFPIELIYTLQVWFVLKKRGKIRIITWNPYIELLDNWTNCSHFLSIS